MRKELHLSGWTGWTMCVHLLGLGSVSHVYLFGVQYK